MDFRKLTGVIMMLKFMQILFIFIFAGCKIINDETKNKTSETHNLNKQIRDFSPLDGNEYEYEYEEKMYSLLGLILDHSCTLILYSQRLQASEIDTIYSIKEELTCIKKETRLNPETEQSKTNRVYTIVEKNGENHYHPDTINSLFIDPLYRFNAIDFAELIDLHYAGKIWTSKFEKGDQRFDGGMGTGRFEFLYVRNVGLVYLDDHYKNGFNTGSSGSRTFRLRKFNGTPIEPDSLVSIAN